MYTSHLRLRRQSLIHRSCWQGKIAAEDDGLPRTTEDSPEPSNSSAQRPHQFVKPTDGDCEANLEELVKVLEKTFAIAQT